ncbi:hypothetical protein DIPPA_02755 [Diplonema papillatum]|nr:hypothetical protein DIPPA_02755 [Diplonema papillatum]
MQRNTAVTLVFFVVLVVLSECQEKKDDPPMLTVDAIRESNRVWMVEWYKGAPLLSQVFAAVADSMNGAVQCGSVNQSDAAGQRAAEEITGEFGVPSVTGSVALFNCLPVHTRAQGSWMSPVQATESSILSYLSGHLQDTTQRIENEEELAAFLSTSRPALATGYGPHYRKMDHLLIFLKRKPADLQLSLQLRAIGNLYWDSLRVGIVALDRLEGKDRKWLGSVVLRCGLRDPEYDASMPGGFRLGSVVEVVTSSRRELIGQQGTVIGQRKGEDGRVDVEFANMVKLVPVTDLRHVSFRGANYSLCLVSDGAAFETARSVVTLIRYSDVVAQLHRNFAIAPSPSTSAPPLRYHLVPGVPISPEPQTLTEDLDDWIWIADDAEEPVKKGRLAADIRHLEFDSAALTEPLTTMDYHEHT